MRVVGVLDSMGVEYAALDVLPALDPLRQATGEIADWRTFPQLYVKGELVGGCRHRRGDGGRPASSPEMLGVEQPAADAEAPQSAKQEMQQDGFSSPPMGIENS